MRIRYIDERRCTSPSSRYTFIKVNKKCTKNKARTSTADLQTKMANSKSSKTSNKCCLFICQLIPFVWTKIPMIQPFVREKLPNKDFSATASGIQGFTLIELIVTMAVAAILISIAVPNLRVFIQNSRIITQANDLIADVSYARSEAIKRRSNTGICKSTDGSTCVGGGNWQDGRLIFADSNNSGALDAGEMVLRTRQALGSADSTLTSPGPDPLIFSSRGTATSATSFTFCDDRGASKGKMINLNSMGQATVSANAPGACF